MKRIVLAAALFLASVTSAVSWSEVCHRIVCAIAWKELGAEAHVALASLLEDDPAASLSEACIWADAIRDNPAYDWARPHHYVNVPIGASDINLARDCPPNRGCVIGAIVTHRRTLNDPNTSSADKMQALKFLTHFIGDIHQPLPECGDFVKNSRFVNVAPPFQLAQWHDVGRAILTNGNCCDLAPLARRAGSRPFLRFLPTLLSSPGMSLTRTRIAFSCCVRVARNRRRYR